MSVESILRNSVNPQWEVFTQHSARTEIQLRGNHTEAEIAQEKTGYGIRVIIPRPNGSGVGFASCNSPDEIASTAKTANALAMLNRSPTFELPVQRKQPSVATIDRRVLRDRSAAAKDYAESVLTLTSDQTKATMTFAKVRMYTLDTEICNSRGLFASSRSTYVYLEIALKVESSAGDTELWPTRYARRIADISPTKIIPHWFEIAESCRRRHSPKTQHTTVIFSPPIACDVFVPTIGYHASAEAFQQKLSQLQPNARVGPDALSIDDDGLYPYGLRTNPFDDEGQPQRRTKLIARGVFKGHLYDQLHACTLKQRSTGNGIRPKSFASDVDERFQVAPANLPTNLSIRPGDATLEELVSEVKEGILVQQAAWIDPDEITTNFGAEIRCAQEIVNGELRDGITGGTLSGRALDLLHQISGISSDAEIVSASSFGCVAPYMRFEKVSIAGPG